MGQDKARHLAAWFFTVAFELAAGIMGQQQEWTVVTILFWLGIASLVVGYLPDLRARAKAGKILAWEFLKQAIVSFVMICAVYAVTIIVLTVIKEWSTPSAELFTPEAWATQHRAFVSERPAALTAYFNKYTQLTANKMLSRYVGKWYAVTGEVEDVTDFDSVTGGKVLFHKANRTLVSLLRKRDDPLVMLSFTDKWLPDIEVLNKGDRISAYCKIDMINGYSVNLADCQVVRR